jgi:hypothetical protein
MKALFGKAATQYGMVLSAFGWIFTGSLHFGSEMAAAAPPKKPIAKSVIKTSNPKNAAASKPAAPPAEASTQKKKKVVYKSHTELDLSGDTIQGRIRAPEVFYIFQRKRADAHHVVKPPRTFDHHTSLTPSIAQPIQEAK